MMHSKCLSLLGAFFVLSMEVLPLNNAQAPQQVPPNFEPLGHNKYYHNKYYLLVILEQQDISWNQAYTGCNVRGGSLFVVENEQESEWLARKINDEKNRGYRHPAKFWVGLVSQAANGPLQWLNKKQYVGYPQVIQISGYDDENKKFAWAVPDGSINELKYEFLTDEDLAEAYMCQYPPA